jgi:hypothetical protein
MTNKANKDDLDIPSKTLSDRLHGEFFGSLINGQHFLMMPLKTILAALLTKQYLQLFLTVYWHCGVA